MGTVIKAEFGMAARRSKVKRSTLCANGHHNWKIETKNQFDVKQGKLVTLQRCQKCGKIKTSAS